MKTTMTITITETDDDYFEENPLPEQEEKMLEAFKARGEREITAAEYLHEHLVESYGREGAEGKVHFNSVMSEFYHDIDNLDTTGDVEPFHPAKYLCSDLDDVWDLILERSM